MKTMLACLLALAIVAAQVLGLAQPIQASAPSFPPAQTPPTRPADTLAFLDAVRAQEPLLAANFSSEEGPWRVETTDDTALAFADGSYHITIAAEDTLEWSTAGLGVADFLAEVDTTFVAGPGTSQYGLFFRYVDDMNAYLFTISGDGMYQLYKLADGDVEMLVEETESDLIEAGRGAANRLGVLAQGPTIALLANGAILTQVEDESFQEGDIALAAGTLSGSGTEIAFDNLAVWDLAVAPEPTRKPTEEPTQEPTSTPTPPAPSTAFDPAVLETIRAEEPLLSESFTRDRGEWSTEATTDSERFFADRAYHLKVVNPNRIGWTNTETPLADFLVEVQAAHVAGPLDGDFGLLFRFVDEDNFYRFAITANGSYAFDKLVDGEWETLIEPTSSAVLETGEGASNRLGVAARGSTIVLLANDAVLAVVDDAEFPEGDLALVAGTYEEPGLEVAFDDLEIWDLAPLADTLPAWGAAPTPEVEALSFDPAVLETVRAEEPVLTESFTRDRGDWSTASADEYESFYADRKYHIRGKTADLLRWHRADVDLDDFLVEADLAQVSGSTDSAGGFVFRRTDDDNMVFFGITGDGRYTLEEKLDGEWRTVIPLTAADAIATGEDASNRLGIFGLGSSLAFLANDTVLATLGDAKLTAGDIALALLTGDEPGAEFAFDDLEIWDLAPLAAQLEGAFTEPPAVTPEVTPEADEPTPAPEPTEAAEPTATPEPTETAAVGFSLEEVEISWGPIWDFADILSDPRVERRTVTLFSGETRDADVVVADVAWYDLPFLEEYTAYFYDADDAEVAEPQPVLLEPLPEETGDVGEVVIVLPEELAGVKYIDVDY